MLTEHLDIIAPTGTEISCKGWIQEAAMRMLMNNLHPDVAENPAELIVYGGKGKAARNWEAYEAIIKGDTAGENNKVYALFDDAKLQNSCWRFSKLDSVSFEGDKDDY